MKKEMVALPVVSLLILVILINFASADSINIGSCSTSGGMNLYLKGVCNHPSWPNGLADYCIDKNILGKAVCTQYGLCNPYTIKCPNGCLNGACFGNPTTTCADSDNGKKYDVSGKITYEGNTFQDACDLTGNAGNLQEWYCDSKGLPNFEVYKCPNGCTAGKSICNTGSNKICKSDSDCASSQVCKNYICVTVSCTPNCLNKKCGDDGCGGSCGSCIAGTTCQNGVCLACTPNCLNKKCGDDGCGGSCGSCIAGTTCQNGVCLACTPNCLNKKCGDDGCGGTCGSCIAGTTCQNGVCLGNPSTTCVDSDGGKDEFIAGTATLTMISSGGKKIVSDKCYVSIWDYLTGKKSTSVDEVFCSFINGKDSIASEVIKCPGECVNGECTGTGGGGTGTADSIDCYITDNEVVCIPSGSNGNGNNGNGNNVNYPKCNSDGDCYSGEKCVNSVCKSSTTCTPNCLNKKCGDDGCGGSCGICITGEICDLNGKCIPSSGCSQDPSTSLILNSFTSISGYSACSYDGDCDKAEKCMLGVCLRVQCSVGSVSADGRKCTGSFWEIKDCIDSDSDTTHKDGINPEKIGVCIDSTFPKAKYVDYKSGNGISEAYCSGNKCTYKKVQCVNGVVNIANGAICKLICVDTDVNTFLNDGKNQFLKGSATDKIGSKTDECEKSGGKNTGVLKEYICSNTGNACEVPIICINGCDSGACIGGANKPSQCKKTDQIYSTLQTPGKAGYCTETYKEGTQIVKTNKCIGNQRTVGSKIVTDKIQEYVCGNFCESVEKNCICNTATNACEQVSV